MKPLQVLFLCERNAGRSQMAEAFCNALGGGRVVAMSAGPHPLTRLHLPVVQVMRELGYDLSKMRPKALTQEGATGADLVVTMGGGQDIAGLVPTTDIRNWDIQDPEGKSVHEVRSIRSMVLQCVTELLASVATGRDWLALPKPRDLAQGASLFAIAAAGFVAARSLGGVDGLVVAGLIGVVALAFANGANDLPKSTATLVGGGALSYRTALFIGTVATLLGGGGALLLSGGLLGLFSAGGITAVDASIHPQFALALVGGATGWVLLATRLSLPVSTTHALVGASLGAALVAVGTGGVRWQTLALAVAVPLLAGPFLGLLVGFATNRVVQLPWFKQKEFGLRVLHWISAVSATAARALNDTPKIAGVGLLVLGIGNPIAVFDNSVLLIVGTVVAMAAGGLWASKGVSRTLAFRLVELDSHNSLAANISNSTIVGSASFFGLPLSTTHVSGAALIGAELQGRKSRIRWGVAGDILAAWIVTVPGSAALTIILWSLFTVLDR